MRRIVPALAIATVAVTLACADSTSPGTVRTPGAPSATIGHPPPPPADTGTYASTTTGQTFFLNTIYFMNPAGNNGWIHFPNQQAGGAIVSPDASIRYHMGEISGKGTITAPVSGGIIIVDLSTVNTGKFNTSCDGGCAEIPFTGTFVNKEGSSSPTDGTMVVGGGQPIITPGT